MAGVRLTAEQLSERIESGKYDSPANARRAIGKVNLTKSEKEQLLMLVHTHFKSGPADLEQQAELLGREGLLRPSGEPTVLEKYRKLLTLKTRAELSDYMGVKHYAVDHFAGSLRGGRQLSRELLKHVSDCIELAYEALVLGKTATPKVTKKTARKPAKKPVVQAIEQEPSIIQNEFDLDVLELDLLNRKQAIIDRLRAARYVPALRSNGVAKA